MIKFDKGAGFMFIIATIVLTLGSVSFNFMHSGEFSAATKIMEVIRAKESSIRSSQEYIVKTREAVDKLRLKLNSIESQIQQMNKYLQGYIEWRKGRLGWEQEF